MSDVNSVKVPASDIVAMYWDLFDSGIINEWAEIVKPADVIIAEDQFIIVWDGE